MPEITRYRITTSTTAPARLASAAGRFTTWGSPGIQPPDLYWSADFATNGFNQYLEIFPTAGDTNGAVVEGIDYGLCPDPEQPSRQVAYLDNRRGKVRGNQNPRVALECPRNVKPRVRENYLDTYWFGCSFRIDSSFSNYAKDSYWLSIGSPAFGAPFTTTSPMALGVWPTGKPGTVRLVVGNAGDMNVPYDTTITTNQWWTIVTAFRFAYAPVGWMQMWMGQSSDGSNLTPLPIKGDALRVIDTMGAGNNDAWYLSASSTPNSSRLSAYSAPGSTARVLFGHHKIAAGIGSPNYFDLVRKP